jgi:hypothetical protein
MVDRVAARELEPHSAVNELLARSGLKTDPSANTT